MPRTIAWHTDCVSDLALDPTGSLYASCSYDGTVHVRDSRSHRCVQVLDCFSQKASLVSSESDWLHCLNFLPNGQLAVGGRIDIKVFNVASGELQKTLRGPATNMSLLPDGRLVTVCDRLIQIWNMTTGECDRTMLPRRCVCSLVVLQDDRVVVGDCSAISVWNTQTGECELVFALLENDIGLQHFKLAALPNGKVAVAFMGGGLTVLNPADGTKQVLFKSTDDFARIPVRFFT
eukprot:GILI01042187.1.p1 GENE.GILI01042187.1~~GILI01042187.1.p1  ORF type:complete len:234 (+),score=6.93 GILI01042187.1:182-883(+)